MRPDRVDAMHFIAQYELRALIEELLDATSAEERQDAVAAMRLWLRTHCRSCGALIDRELRRRDAGYCYVCFPPPAPDLEPPHPAPPGGPDDVPF